MKTLDEMRAVVQTLFRVGMAAWVAAIAASSLVWLPGYYALVAAGAFAAVAVAVGVPFYRLSSRMERAQEFRIEGLEASLWLTKNHWTNPEFQNLRAMDAMLRDIDHSEEYYHSAIALKRKLEVFE